MAQLNLRDGENHDKKLNDFGIDKVLLVENSGLPISAYGIDIDNDEEVDKFIMISALLKAVRSFFEISDCARIDSMRIDNLHDDNGKVLLEIGSEWEDYQEDGEQKWRIYENFTVLFRDLPEGEIQSQILRSAFKDLVKNFNIEYPELIGKSGTIDLGKYMEYVPHFLRDSLQEVNTEELKDELGSDDELIKLFDYKKDGNDLQIRSNKGQLLTLKNDSLVDEKTGKVMDLHSGHLRQPHEIEDDVHPDSFTYFDDIPTAGYCPCTLFENLPMYLHELAPTYHSIAADVYMTKYDTSLEKPYLTSSIGIIDGAIRFLITIRQESEDVYVGSMLRIGKNEHSSFISRVTKFFKDTFKMKSGKDLVREVHKTNSFL